MNIGDKIAELRRQNKMTQKDLAEMINVSDKVISKWETGKSLPDVEAMMRISKTFNVSVSELYDCIEKTDTKNAEDYNEERIWHYKKYSIISYVCMIAIPLLQSYVDVYYSSYLPNVRDTMYTFVAISRIVLFLLSVVFQLTNFVRLYSYSSKKYYKADYRKVLIICGVLFILISYFSLWATFNKDGMNFVTKILRDLIKGGNI